MCVYLPVCLPPTLARTPSLSLSPLFSLSQHLRHRSAFLSPRSHRSRCSHSTRRHSHRTRSIRSRQPEAGARILMGSRRDPRASSSPPRHDPLPTRAAAASLRAAARGRRSAPRRPASPTQPNRKRLRHPPFEGLAISAASSVSATLPCLHTPYTRHPLTRV